MVDCRWSFRSIGIWTWKHFFILSSTIWSQLRHIRRAIAYGAYHWTDAFPFSRLLEWVMSDIWHQRCARSRFRGDAISKIRRKVNWFSYFRNVIANNVEPLHFYCGRIRYCWAQRMWARLHVNHNKASKAESGSKFFISLRYRLNQINQQFLNV